MKRKLIALGCCALLAIGSLTASASEETAAFIEAETETLLETEAPIEAETETLSETEALSETGTVAPEMQACREFLGKYFTVDLQEAMETLWMIQGAGMEDYNSVLEELGGEDEEGTVISLSREDSPALSSVLDELFEERFPAMSEELKEELTRNRFITMNLKLAEEAGSDVVLLSQSLENESVNDDGQVSYSFQVTVQAGSQEQTAAGTIAVTPNEDGGFTFTSFYIK